MSNYFARYFFEVRWHDTANFHDQTNLFGRKTNKFRRFAKLFDDKANKFHDQTNLFGDKANKFRRFAKLFDDKTNKFHGQTNLFGRKAN